MDGEPLVQLEAVAKRFDGAAAKAVDGVSAKVFGGRVTGLVGPDGAGKTTLMRLIDGLLEPSGGSIKACGFDTRIELADLRAVVSYMPQRFGLYEDLTVAENLNLYADLRGVVGDERRSAIARLLQFTGLAPFTGRLAGKLSGGMKQKLGLACSLVRTPKLLLLDEPSVGVDPISRRELWQLVYELVDQGVAVVWSTAYLDEAERCATVLALSEGKLLYDGRPDDLTRRMEGRCYLVRGVMEKRQVLMHALRRSEVLDGVIQGRSVRLVVREGLEPPTGEQLNAPEAEVVAASPRFEDAFVDLLGGGPRKESPFVADAEQSNHDGAVLVEADRLTKRFGTFTAASEVSFEIGRGEIFGLLGPNGAGKSTTFKMLCGLLRPTSGTAKVAGQDLAQAGGRARAQLGYMAQKFSLYGDLSVRQNLEFFAGVYGLSGGERRRRVDELVDAFELRSFLSTSAGLLPLGFKQRLALASAVIHRPPVLFLDEPTSGVDPLTRREFWSHINAMVERGVTVLVTTHFLDEAEYCDRIALVYKGTVIASGSPDDLKDQVKSDRMAEPTLEDAFISLVEAFDPQGAAA